MTVQMRYKLRCRDNRCAQGISRRQEVLARFFPVSLASADNNLGHLSIKVEWPVWAEHSEVRATNVWGGMRPDSRAAWQLRRDSSSGHSRDYIPAFIIIRYRFSSLDPNAMPRGYQAALRPLCRSYS